MPPEKRILLETLRAQTNLKLHELQNLTRQEVTNFIQSLRTRILMLTNLSTECWLGAIALMYLAEAQGVILTYYKQPDILKVARKEEALSLMYNDRALYWSKLASLAKDPLLYQLYQNNADFETRVAKTLMGSFITGTHLPILGTILPDQFNILQSRIELFSGLKGLIRRNTLFGHDLKDYKI